MHMIFRWYLNAWLSVNIFKVHLYGCSPWPNKWRFSFDVSLLPFHCRNTIKRNIPRPTAIIGEPSSLTNHYKVPKPIPGKKGNAAESAEKVASPPFSPDHYEVAPCFNNEDAPGKNPIYENAEFDSSLETSQSGLWRPVYENMSYNGHHNSLPVTSALDDDPDNEYINPEEFTGELSPPIKRNSSGETSNQAQHFLNFATFLHDNVVFNIPYTTNSYPLLMDFNVLKACNACWFVCKLLQWFMCILES